MNRVILTATLTAAVLSMSAQDSLRDDYNDFLKSAREEYNSFRDEANKAYSDFLSAPWEPIEPLLLQKPIDKSRPPRPFEERDHDGEDHSLKFETIITPQPPQPAPGPIEPIVIAPSPTDKWIDFSYLGNTDKVRIPDGALPTVNDISESGISRAWANLSDGNFNATLADCLNLRTRYNLPDWAYLNMLNIISQRYYGRKCNGSTLLMAWLYSQSGYTMRLAREANRDLIMMFASDHVIYGNYYILDNTNYYPFDHAAGSFNISQASCPNEKVMSLVLTSLPLTAKRLSQPRNRKSRKYPEMECDLSVDENLMEFFITYPNSQIGSQAISRWAIYANTPLSETVREQLYPKFQSALEGMTDRDKVEHLLNWVQTGFIYELDDKVWGCDRAFFPDETIYYPYADCEDRAILFTRLVRDLTGLDAILVHYPGHLASGVAFKGEEPGDYILLNGRRFTVCDPTFTDGAPVGRTGSAYDNSTASVILLSR